MAAFSDTRNLSSYFRHSSQFYYILTDLQGDFIYANPLFQNEFSHIDDKEKYQKAIKQCLENPLAIVSTELKIKSGKGSVSTIRWEFSLNSNDETNPGSIQGIGILVDEEIEDLQKDITAQRKDEQYILQNDKQDFQKQKQLIQAAIDGHEKEKQEIGKELHDNINQHLTTTSLYLEVAREKVTGESFEIINLAHKNLLDIIKEIRQLSQSLVPLVLCDIGLIESVKDICASLQKTHSFTINFYHRHFNENQLPANLKLMLFRIIQEQINNIIRHAHADTIQIRLQSDAEYIILFIGDNGRGFDLSDFKKGSGLINIDNRAGLFNGQVKIDASPANGCSISVSIPSTDMERQEMSS